MDEGNDGGKLHSRKHRREKNRRSTRRHHRYQRFEDTEGKDDVSCCGRPRQKSDSRRRKHYRHRRRHKSKRHHKSQKDIGGIKEEMPSPLRPPTPPLSQQPVTNSVAVSKEKQKEEKESGELASTNQGKQSTSGEITGQGKLSSQLGTSRSPPALPSRDSQNINGRESGKQIMAMYKTELLQELCVTQCIRDGYEICRMAYTTCFPVSKKPNFIYLPQLRFTANGTQKKSSTQTSVTNLAHETAAQSANISQSQISDLAKEKNFMSETKIDNFVENLNECCMALRKARKNIANVKLLVGGETLGEVHRYDIDTKAIINDLKYLEQNIHRKITI
ncbi:hypothetical protein ACH3XW_32795 [Acanthocheilonema viteae]|uniref:Uncharacterized protein n=1 Tax=Acanthocheilonema viteae TaxID=6277 RepID=A0A498SEU2_ACAVI|nr:unnamed protein product [Acanthocheilonema viteae]